MNAWDGQASSLSIPPTCLIERSREFKLFESFMKHENPYDFELSNSYNAVESWFPLNYGRGLTFKKFKKIFSIHQNRINLFSYLKKNEALLVVKCNGKKIFARLGGGFSMQILSTHYPFAYCSQGRHSQRLSFSISPVISGRTNSTQL